MDKRDYDWLLADAVAWLQRLKELEDGDDRPRLASVQGVYGTLCLAGWVATNDGAIGAVLVGTWVSACAKYRANFAVVLKFCAKRVWAPNSDGRAIFSYGDPVLSHLILDSPDCAKPHAPSQNP